MRGGAGGSSGNGEERPGRANYGDQERRTSESMSSLSLEGKIIV